MVEPKRIEQRKLSDLKVHPRQDRLFRSLTGAEFERFKASMAAGLNEPVEILPDGTILDGHQRVRAAHELGWTEIEVWMRDDLANNPAAANRRHVEANRGRRQLDALDQVRLAQALMEDDKQRKPGGLANWERDELRKRLRAELNLSNRHIQRLMNVATAPMAVQQALSSGRIGIVLAEKVSRMPKNIQDEIAKAIESNADPEATVKQHVETAAMKAADPSRVFQNFVRVSAPALDVLEKHLDDIKPGFCEYDNEMATLNRLAVFIEQVIPVLREKRDSVLAREWNDAAAIELPEEEAD